MMDLAYLKDPAGRDIRMILASASPRRAALLRQIGMNFRIMPSGEDESDTEKPLPGKLPAEPEMLVTALAERKARTVYRQVRAEQRKDEAETALTVIIGADTLVVRRNHVLGKPIDREDACRMLRMLQGGWHCVYTGLALVMTRRGEIIGHQTAVETTRVKMATIPEAALARYVDSGEPMDKAGAYGIQGIGSLWIERIDGCYYNVMGLPLNRLQVMLTAMMTAMPADVDMQE